MSSRKAVAASRQSSQLTAAASRWRVSRRNDVRVSIDSTASDSNRDRSFRTCRSSPRLREPMINSASTTGCTTSRLVRRLVSKNTSLASTPLTASTRTDVSTTRSFTALALIPAHAVRGQSAPNSSTRANGLSRCQTRAADRSPLGAWPSSATWVKWRPPRVPSRASSSLPS